jgi:hypothetical protein
MYAALDIYTDDVYTLHTECHENRADVIIAAADLLEAEPYATVLRVTLVTPHDDGFYVRSDLTSDVLALRNWRHNVWVLTA